MNSLKSVCSFAKATPVPFHQFEEDVEPLLGRQFRIITVVSVFGIFETTEYANDPFHTDTLTSGHSSGKSRCASDPRPRDLMHTAAHDPQM
jgi:hypothetical protein